MTSANPEAADKPDPASERFPLGTTSVYRQRLPAGPWWEHMHDALAVQRENLSRVMAAEGMPTQSPAFWARRALGTALDTACQILAGIAREGAAPAKAPEPEPDKCVKCGSIYCPDEGVCCNCEPWRRSGTKLHLPTCAAEEKSRVDAAHRRTEFVPSCNCNARGAFDHRAECPRRKWLMGEPAAPVCTCPRTAGLLKQAHQNGCPVVGMWQQLAADARDAKAAAKEDA